MVVQELSEVKRHTIFFDNFFISNRLPRNLGDCDMKAAGTVRVTMQNWRSPPTYKVRQRLENKDRKTEVHTISSVMAMRVLLLECNSINTIESNYMCHEPVDKVKKK